MSLKIDSYRHGRIEVDGKTYEQDIVIAGDRVQLCYQTYKRKKRLTRSYIEHLLEFEPEILIIGLGAGSKLGLTKKAFALLEESGVEWHVRPTKSAVKLYNKLRREKNVVAVLHLAS
jgi:hypothetical protein